MNKPEIHIQSGLFGEDYDLLTTTELVRRWLMMNPYKGNSDEDLERYNKAMSIGIYLSTEKVRRVLADFICDSDKFLVALVEELQKENLPAFETIVRQLRKERNKYKGQ